LIVLGVDSGSLCTGYGVVQGDGRLHRALEWGAIRNPPSAGQPERLAGICRNLREVMRKFQPGVLALEGVFYCKNAQSALKLGQVRGAVMMTALEEGLEVREFSPAEVKLAVTGYGRAEKAQVQTMVRAILGLAKLPQPHDAADALALALCALNRQGWDKKVGRR
jgi:crossover junction endodeoxyribonuclease RuvC